MNKYFLEKAKELVSIGDQYLSSEGDSFHLFARELLLKNSLEKSFDLNQFALSAFSKEIPESQNYRFMEFSDLPLTVARGEHCFIDLYVWRRRPTTIHNHHFSGAFQCLYGENIDITFRFTPEKNLSRIHTLGKLETLEERKVLPGHVEAIDLQDKFIHQNHHLSDLTVNLCFRTVDKEGIRLSSFLHSGLKCEKDEESLRMAERLFRFSQISEMDVNKVGISTEASIAFLIENYKRSNTQKIAHSLNENIIQATDVDVLQLLDAHEELLDCVTFGIFE